MAAIHNDQPNVHAARQLAHVCGVLSRAEPVSDNKAVNVPLTLRPYNFPRELFQLVWDIQPHLNSLVDALSRDTEFLEEALGR